MTTQLTLLALVALLGFTQCDGDDGTDESDMPTTDLVATLTPGRDITTMINVMRAPSGEQLRYTQQLTDAMRREIRGQSGFISASVHRSLDNDYIVNYAQWESEGDVDAVVAVVGAGEKPILAEVFAATAPDFHPYRLVEQFAAADPAGIVAVDSAAWTMINVLQSTEGVTQTQLADLLREGMREDASRQPGFRSATVHVSLDNDYVVNYAQWDDAASVGAVVEKVQAGELPALGAAFGAASVDFHPYEVASQTFAP